MTNKRGRGLILNRTETADQFGIAMTTLDDWVRRDCPVVQRGGRGRPWQFNTADLMKWREADIRAQSQGVQSASADELKRRKLEAETEMAELDLAKAKDLVAPIEQIERALSKAFGEVRANLRNVVPGRAARRLVGETNQTIIKVVLLEEIDQALEALADNDLINETDLELAEEDEGED
ncbi:terminase small subunit [uncultured Ruegeria sp.]|uniref:terminase small subunit n=1 Tax=uncultured Ruegeria sp. TaxID=259304 RepID=UPI00260BABBE|nr:terminase small subunit [uncultured Ruegeria sp.]